MAAATANTEREKTRKIIKAAGGASFLARELGTTRQAIYLWARVPVRHARKVAKLAKRPLRSVRPDVYC